MKIEREREQNDRPTFFLQSLTRIIFAAQHGDLVCARASIVGLFELR